MRKDFAAVWGKRPIADITTEDVLISHSHRQTARGTIACS